MKPSISTGARENFNACLKRGLLREAYRRGLATEEQLTRLMERWREA